MKKQLEEMFRQLLPRLDIAARMASVVHCERSVLRALTRATALVAEGLSEERLLPLLARCAAEAAGAELAAAPLQQRSWAQGP